jgi:hypothetical protein
MSLRDWFAAENNIPVGDAVYNLFPDFDEPVLANRVRFITKHEKEIHAEIARLKYSFADAMIAEREKQNES